MARCLLSGKTESEANMKGTKLVGAVLLALGLLVFAYGGFSYAKETDKVSAGPVHTGVQDTDRVNLPLWAGVGVAIVGVVLLKREN